MQHGPRAKSSHHTISTWAVATLSATITAWIQREVAVCSCFHCFSGHCGQIWSECSVRPESRGKAAFHVFLIKLSRELHGAIVGAFVVFFHFPPSSSLSSQRKSVAREYHRSMRQETAWDHSLLHFERFAPSPCVNCKYTIADSHTSLQGPVQELCSGSGWATVRL